MRRGSVRCLAGIWSATSEGRCPVLGTPTLICAYRHHVIRVMTVGGGGGIADVCGSGGQ